MFSTPYTASSSFFLFFSSFFCFILSVYTCETLVKTKYGDVCGVTRDGHNAYLGIPYAEPPLSSLRWSPPLPRHSWYPNVWNATSFARACPQTGNASNSPFSMSEDCLYLNVWTPQTSGKKGEKNNSFPVMLFIHGGGWTQGFGHQPLFWGDFLANSTDTVLVSFNYRLGALGFLYHPNMGSNFGLLDQRLVLQWVHENIADFNGDPERVTLFGQSAGGFSVAYHVTSTESQPFFQKAVMQSSPSGLILRTPSQSWEYTDIFSLALECFPSDVKCLRSKSVQDILDAQGDTFWLPLPLNTEDDLPWQPVLDGVIVTGQILELMHTGKIDTAKPVILGHVRDEAFSFVYGSISHLSAWEYETFIYGWLGFSAGSQALSLYPLNATTASSNSEGSETQRRHFLREAQGKEGRKQVQEVQAEEEEDPRSALSRLITDAFLVCPSYWMAELLYARGVNVHSYAFMHPPKRDPINNTPYCRDLRACHGAELAFVFQSERFFRGFDWGGERERQLSNLTMTLWAEFAHNNNAELSSSASLVASRSASFSSSPSSSSSSFLSSSLSSPLWPAWDNVTRSTLSLDFSPQILHSYRQKWCDFWRAHFSRV